MYILLGTVVNIWNLLKSKKERKITLLWVVSILWFMSKSFHLFKNCCFASHFSNPSLDCFIHFKGDNNIKLAPSFTKSLFGVPWICASEEPLDLGACLRPPYIGRFHAGGVHFKRVICLIILVRSMICMVFGLDNYFVHPSICSLLHSCSLCRHVMFNLWGGALHGSRTNGCVADYLSRCTLRTFVGDGQYYSSLCENGHGVMWNDESQASSIF